MRVIIAYDGSESAQEALDDLERAGVETEVHADSPARQVITEVKNGK